MAISKTQPMRPALIDVVDGYEILETKIGASNVIPTFKGIFEWFHDEMEETLANHAGACAGAYAGNDLYIFVIRDANNTTGVIYSANLATGAVRQLLKTEVGHAQGAAYDFENNEFYLCPSHVNNIYADEIYIYSFNGDVLSFSRKLKVYGIPNHVRNIAIDPVTNKLYGTSSHAPLIYEINKTTGQVTNLNCGTSILNPNSLVYKEQENALSNGLAAYDGIVYAVFAFPHMIIGFNVESATYNTTIGINDKFSNAFPIEEIENISFDEYGNAFLIANNYKKFNPTNGHCSFGVINKDYSGFVDTRELDVVYVVDDKTNRLANGSQSYPFKSIESMCMLHANRHISYTRVDSDYNHTLKIRNFFGGAETPYLIRCNKIVDSIDIIGNVSIYGGITIKPEKQLDNALYVNRASSLTISNVTFDFTEIQPVRVAFVDDGSEIHFARTIALDSNHPDIKTIYRYSGSVVTVPTDAFTVNNQTLYK